MSVIVEIRSGSGGQARNKTSNCVMLRHIPTDTLIRCESGRSQYQNKETALSMLRAKLYTKAKDDLVQTRIQDRKQQVGSGQRADKRRTVQHQNGQVLDHYDGRRWRLKDYLKGNW